MNTKLPTIRQLEYFITVAKSSNFRRAAEKLKVSQPTLTMQIAAMEELMGVQLFDRSRAGTLLAPAGRDLLPLARDILERYELLGEAADTRKQSLAGTFRMGVSPTIGPNLLPRILPRLHAEYPALKLHINEAVPKELEQGLEDGTYDIILTVLPMHAGENKIRPLFTEQIKVVMAADHPLAKKSKLLSRDLHQQAILSINENHHLHRQTQLVCDRFGAELQRQHEGNSLSALRLMVMMGMGIALLPALFIETESNKSDSLKTYALQDEPLTRTHIAAWRKNSSARHLFQKLSFEIKAIAMDAFGKLLEDVIADENVPETW
jgi:LysR family transcriptional regulator, hydrogen peroxide-inducible genes activator